MQIMNDWIADLWIREAEVKFLGTFAA